MNCCIFFLILFLKNFVKTMLFKSFSFNIYIFIKPVLLKSQSRLLIHIFLLQVCKLGHVANRWCSQSILNRRMHAGDLVFASAILLSGNNFQKISTLAKFLKLPILSSSSFHRIQKTYLVPSIDRFWIQKQESTLREFQNTDIIVLGKY